MNRKGFAPLIVVGIIAAITVIAGVSIWYFGANKYPAPTLPSPSGNSTTQSSNVDNSKWSIYVNRQYGFSFSYPGTLIDAGRSLIEQDSFSGPAQDEFDISLYDTTGTVIDVVNSYLHLPGDCPGNHIVQQDKNGYLFELSCNGSNTYRNNYYYVFESSHHAIIFMQLDDIDFLATFKKIVGTLMVK
jgi:hypothetical protein